MSGRPITRAEGTQLCRDVAAVLDQLAELLDALGRQLDLAAAAGPPPRLDTCPTCGCLIRTTGRAPEVGAACPGCRAAITTVALDILEPGRPRLPDPRQAP